GVELVALKANLYLIFSEKKGSLFSMAEQLRQAGSADGDLRTGDGRPRSDSGPVRDGCADGRPFRDA
ncbi:MAG: hypothetical protein II739_02705, partial [Clostridia bacterium]|nr:hypothetical protein [Clostridia bacterium]